MTGRRRRRCANSTQNTRLPEASRNAASGDAEHRAEAVARRWLRDIRLAERRQADVARDGRAGRSRRRRARTSAGWRPPSRAPRASPNARVIVARSGRNTSCPVALLAVSRPTARPRRAENQRVATVAPSTSAVMPVPRPTTTPHDSTNCQTTPIKIVPMMPATISATAKPTTARNAEAVDERGGEWAHQAEQRQAQRKRRRDVRVRPTEFALRAAG